MLTMRIARDQSYPLAERLLKLCRDPLPTALTAAASARRPTLPKTTFGPQRLRSKFSSVA
jgi:hypothetical protein